MTGAPIRPAGITIAPSRWRAPVAPSALRPLRPPRCAVQVTTEKSLRQQAGEALGVDLAERKQYIRQLVRRKKEAMCL